MKLAAIDIGSNAARLLITEVEENGKGTPLFNKLNLVRVPLRLGFDVFETGDISKIKINKVVETIKAYKHLLNIYEVQYLKACATSAMRDAKNAGDIIRKVKMETGIEIRVISGDEEASFIYENHIAENLAKDHSYLYIDVGGGSTELTFFNDGKLVFKESFNIGTIRLLKGLVNESHWDEMKNYIKLGTKGKSDIIAIGSGGNINKVFSLSKKKEGKPLSLELLRDYHKELSSFTLAERMKQYKLREDRADVILPALQIYVNVMRWANIEEIYVPKIGLADGLVHMLYDEVKNKKLHASTVVL
ncbi:exopolyphosphatase/guanosine-5'-triphosphate,3'-diphosphate pyrophosphatase [Lacibacter cauensis]|uniref:Exopolyphosphatase/guanosine-5'-triphosphate, 3'-diphosphate pyrophosphatase n=1 Tax=Lacibacter cauensis TaxID=510947 RepID=A0A562SVR3_9BACT|nr:exopolyphosphatase [Lacibacter cauensis]TWI85355.1 exopolyphosphatase/guanosine-5'-triphosphate,3'-diphosphate pyrophosphatase [Lacibacter cauensis]